RALPGAGAGVPDDQLDYWRGRAELRCGDAARRAAGRERLARLGLRGPSDPVAAFEAGRALLFPGQPAAAVTLLSPAAQPQYQELLAYDLLVRAFAALHRAAEAYWARGRAHSARGQFRSAAASLRRSIELDSSRPAVFLDLARALSLAGQPREA